MTNHERTPAATAGGLGPDDLGRLDARVRRLRAETLRAGLRGAAALLAGALAFIRCAAAGQALRVPERADCGRA